MIRPTASERIVAFAQPGKSSASPFRRDFKWFRMRENGGHPATEFKAAGRKSI
jgi:hypothetical protein